MPFFFFLSFKFKFAQSCVGTYKFIGRGTGIGRKGKKITYAEAWKGFEKSFTSARVPCKSIERYPVVARWRNDVDYVAAGPIYYFLMNI